MLQFGPNCKHAALSGILPGFLLRPLKQAVSPKQKKVLVLMSNTGGGHRASAEALEAGFKQLYGDKYAPTHIQYFLSCDLAMTVRTAARLLNVMLAERTAVAHSILHAE